MTPFLVTGCGRSGTGWAAALFTALGHPCDHEEAFSYDRHGPLVKPESSWLAVPYVDSLPEDTRVLRIMRDPYKVVQSIIACGFLDRGDEYDEFVLHHRLEIVRPFTHLGRAIRYVALWDEPLQGRAILHTNYKAPMLARTAKEATGEQPRWRDVRHALRVLGTGVNAKPVNQWLAVPTREEIDADPDGILIRLRAEQFGYL